jgi:hypothetical protein
MQMNNGGQFSSISTSFIAAAHLLVIGKVFIVMLCYEILNWYFTVI